MSEFQADPNIRVVLVYSDLFNLRTKHGTVSIIAETKSKIKQNKIRKLYKLANVSHLFTLHTDIHLNPLIQRLCAHCKSIVIAHFMKLLLSCQPRVIVT